MSAEKINKILDIYKVLYRIPSLASARIIPSPTGGTTIQSVWSERNLERRTKQKFIKEFTFNVDQQLLVESYPVDVTTELLTSFSDDENFKAVLRDATIDGKSKQFIEIWNKQHIYKSYDLSAFDVHGDVYTEQRFSAFNLSPDGTRLLYVAEKKLQKCEPFYKQKSKSKPKSDDSGEEEPSRGTEYIYKPDWGEQLVGKHKSVIAILNVNTDTIDLITTVPDELFPAQVMWAPDGTDIVGVAYKLQTTYLGLYACTNRESCIFHLKGTEREYRNLTAENLSCVSPQFSPDGKHLIWLERDISPAHHHVHRLMHLKWNSTERPNILVDLVKTYVEISNNKKFYGLYCQSLPKRCWSHDSRNIFLSTQQKCNVKSYIINLETKKLFEIENRDTSSLVVLDVAKFYVAFSKLSVIEPPQLVAGKYGADLTVQNLNLFNCTTLFDIPNKKDLMYEQTEFSYKNNDSVKEFNFTYIGSKSGPDQSVPLMVALHGGPHSSFANMFSPDYLLFAYLGFEILQINYRGSIGMGGDSVDYLLGKVGKADVLDCVTAIDLTLKKYPWIDAKKVNLYGGSHGGFLGAHLSGQHPDKFKSVVLLNPVIDIGAMYATTDIPDWCRAESGCSYIKNLTEGNEETNYSQLILKMLNHSPILHVDKVKAPTLIALGTKDLRVPLSQGKLWYNRLVSNYVKTKLFIYEDNHSLMKDEVEIDNDVNVALWLLEHNNI